VESWRGWDYKPLRGIQIGGRRQCCSIDDMPSAPEPVGYVLSPHPLALETLRQHLAAVPLVLESIRLPHSAHLDLSALARRPSAVCVVDACYPPVAAERVVAQLMGALPGSRTLVLTEDLDETPAFRLLRLGVKGLLPYAQVAEQIRPSLLAVARGGFWVPRELLSRFVDSLLAGGASRQTLHPAGLSIRENDVLECLLTNLANKEIAVRLGISERTVKFHVSNLLGKFGVQRRADLILQSYQARSSEAVPS
jgi:DNA-binding NarL/FixJ family response regulator